MPAHCQLTVLEIPESCFDPSSYFQSQQRQPDFIKHHSKQRGVMRNKVSSKLDDLDDSEDLDDLLSRSICSLRHNLLLSSNTVKTALLKSIFCALLVCANVRGSAPGGVECAATNLQVK